MGNILDKNTLKQALRAANSKLKNGDLPGASAIYHDILIKFPKNKVSIDKLNWIDKHQQKNITQKDIDRILNFYNSGSFAEAINATCLLLRDSPRSALLYYLLGVIRFGLGEFDEAIGAFASAIELKPNYAEAFNHMGNALNMGNALKDKKRSREAIYAYKKAIELKPNYAEAHYNLGVAHIEQSDADAAIVAYAKAIEIEPNFREALYNLSLVLIGREFKKPNPSLEAALIGMLDKKSLVHPSNICLAAISLLKFNTSLRNYLDNPADAKISQCLPEVVNDLCGFPLLLKLMALCPITDTQLEELFTALRKEMLFASLERRVPENLWSFQSRLAIQCFINEYVYDVESIEEVKAIKELEKIAKEIFESGGQPSPDIILSLSCYKDLYQYNWHDILVSNIHIKDVYSCQVEERRVENQIRSNIKNLKPISNQVSDKVANQYESNPYPRWIELGLALRPMTIAGWAKELNLQVEGQFLNQLSNPSILIAGCGTGHQAISAASRYSDSRVLAVDLSLSSLAYAKRKTAELGIQNIDYIQGDILDFGQLHEEFELIECSGVLHHMEDPIVGWEKLHSCLRPGGLMKIGLYSDLGRQHIVQIRKEIKALGLKPVVNDIRKFRKIIMGSEKDHHKRIQTSDDFYTLSNIRDLLFHVQEHRFTIPQIIDCLGELGLKFCGFQTAQISEFKRFYNEIDDRYDLNKWHQYELRNPTAFAGMYQFWCQKII